MKKFLVLALALLASAPACAITQQQAHDRFDHLIGKQNNNMINSLINKHCARMVEQTGAASDNETFMDEFGEFLAIMLRIAQSPSLEQPAGMAQILTELLKRAYTMRMNVSEWIDINPLDPRLAGAFAECLPTETLTNAFSEANSRCPLAGRSPLALLANAAQIVTYIKLVRQFLKQADQGLGILESFISDPNTLLTTIAALAQAK